MMNSLGLGCSPIHNTYWLGIVPHTESLAVVAPIESVITCHVCPSSHVSLIPSAVAMYVVSPRVTIPPGATYCHSGPSWRNSQFFQVFPLSIERPQPLPTVPYQTWPRGPKANACTKSQEIECSDVSDEARIRSHSPLPTPRRNTKIPSPYVPTQVALSGARAIARTCTPHPDESGSGGTPCKAANNRRAVIRAASRQWGASESP